MHYVYSTPAYNKELFPLKTQFLSHWLSGCLNAIDNALISQIQFIDSFQFFNSKFYHVGRAWIEIYMKASLVTRRLIEKHRKGVLHTHFSEGSCDALWDKTINGLCAVYSLTSFDICRLNVPKNVWTTKNFLMTSFFSGFSVLWSTRSSFCRVYLELVSPWKIFILKYNMCKNIFFANLQWYFNELP